MRQNHVTSNTAGHQLACYSCNAVFKDVLSAAEHTLECVEPPTSIKKPECIVKKKDNSNKIKIPRPPRTWIRKYEAILLGCIRDHAELIGQAKAKVGKKPYTDVMEVLAKKLQISIGEWVDRKAIIKKWLSLLRRARNFDLLQKGDQLLGYLHLDPPEFYGSIKEIENEIQKAKWRALQGDKQEKDNGEAVEGNSEPDVEDHGENVAVQECKVEADVEYVVDSGTQERKCIEVVDVGSTMMRKDVVLSILNRLEQGGASPTEVAQEFGIDVIFLDLLKQRKEIIIQGIERCSLCHLLLGNKKELVTHELQCSAKNKWVENRSDDKSESDNNFQFLPATVERLVQLVIETNPRENRRNTWKKIAFHLSVLQDGVTVKRCNQKWRNLVNQCRSYEQLDKWAAAHSYTHSRPVPDYYHMIMPYVDSCHRKKTRPSLDAIRKFVSNMGSGKEDDGSWDGSSSFNDPGNEENEDGAADFEEGDLNDSCDPDDIVPVVNIPSKSKKQSEPGGDIIPSVKITAKSESQQENCSDIVPSVKITDKSKSPLDSPSKMNVQKRHTGEGVEDGIHIENNNEYSSAQETIKHQAGLITKFENKLDNALVLLRDMSRENQRLSKMAETRKDPGMVLVGESIRKMAQMQAEMQTQMTKQLETMTSMWERHHQENLAVMKSLITELGRKNVAKVVIAKPGDQSCDTKGSKPDPTGIHRIAEADQSCDSGKGKPNGISYNKTSDLPQTSDSETTEPAQTVDNNTAKSNRTCIIMRKKRQDLKCNSKRNTKLNQTCDSNLTKPEQASKSKTPKGNQTNNNVTRKPEDEITSKRIKRRKIILDY